VKNIICVSVNTIFAKVKIYCTSSNKCLHISRNYDICSWWGHVWKLYLVWTIDYFKKIYSGILINDPH